MKIRYLNTGSTAHVENQLGNSLIQAGLAEAVLERTIPLTAPRPTPKYSVVLYKTHVRQKDYIALRMVVGNRTEFFTGDPSRLDDKFFGWPVSTIPADVLTQYSAEWKKHPELRLVQSYGYQTHAKLEDIREQRLPESITDENGRKYYKVFED
jgi:hypothetical protein